MCTRDSSCVSGDIRDRQLEHEHLLHVRTNSHADKLLTDASGKGYACVQTWLTIQQSDYVGQMASCKVVVLHDKLQVFIKSMPTSHPISQAL